MWHWLSIRDCSSVWACRRIAVPLTLCIYALLLSIPSRSEIPSTSSGSVSQSEQVLLWTEGNKAISESRFQDAANYLSRYVDRYAGSSDYLKAHLLLGKAWVELGKTEKAIKPLKYFLDSNGNILDSARARLLLGHAYLDQDKSNEAYLSTVEIDQMGTKVSLPPDMILEALLIKGDALLGLNQLSRATEVLDFAAGKLSDQNDSEVKSQTFDLQLKLKTMECARFPSKERLDEGQIRDQLDRRGTCLLESLLTYRKILKTGNVKSSAMAVMRITEAFENYSQSCRNPSWSGKQRPVDSKEMRQYQVELTDRLKKDCKLKWVSALDLLNSWKMSLPNAVRGSLVQTTQSIEKFSGDL